MSGQCFRCQHRSKIVKKPASGDKRFVNNWNTARTTDAATMSGRCFRCQHRSKIAKKPALGDKRFVNNWNTARTTDAAAQI